MRQLPCAAQKQGLGHTHARYRRDESGGQATFAVHQMRQAREDRPRDREEQARRRVPRESRRP